MTANFLPSERKLLSLLMSIMALRMVGLFAFIPVAALLVDSYPGASGSAMGLALGIYGLTQACFQLPMGALSDRWGRKPVIVMGLVLFVVGSALSAWAPTLTWLSVGRALQGVGAVGSVLMALLADNTRTEVRSRSMAWVGITMGASFFIALLIGPLVVKYWGFSGLFSGMTLLGGVGLAATLWAMPRLPPREIVSFAETVQHMSRLPLWWIYISIALLHMVLSSLFLVLPLSLWEHLQVDKYQAWQIYVPALVLSIGIMMPYARRSQTAAMMVRGVFGGIALMGMSLFALGYANRPWEFILSVTLFFGGFNLLEALLPALLSTLVEKARGSAMGIFGSFQFFGIFLGGSLGGLVWEHLGVHGVYMASGVICCLWCVSLFGLRATLSAKH